MTRSGLTATVMLIFDAEVDNRTLTVIYGSGVTMMVSNIVMTWRNIGFCDDQEDLV